MRRDENCIVPDCDEGTYTGAKPIYIQLTVDGKRTWKRVGHLCRRHLPDGEPGDREITSWLVGCPAGDVNFKYQLEKADLPLLRQVIERLEDELRRGFPHKTRIKKIAARIRALEKELLKKDVEHDYGTSVVDQVLPRKEKDADELCPRVRTTSRPAEPSDPSRAWRAISDLGKKVLPGTERVHCDTCGCDNVPDKDGDGNVFCSACDALIEAAVK